MNKLLTVVRESPVAVFALVGLTVGSIIHPFNDSIGHIIWMVTLVIGGFPIVWRTLLGMLKGNFASDVVAMLAIVTAVAMDQAFAGAIVLLMQTGGEALESYSLRRASSSLDELLARAPRIAHRRTGDQLADIDVADVAVGDTLVVRPGDILPVDGALLSALAEVDESALTGEPLGRPKEAGDELLSGSVNTGDAFEYRAVKVAADSQYSRIVELVRQAQEEKPPIQRLADTYAVWFTPITLVMCAIGWAYTGNYHTILSVLVVATPCPLILAVPVAVISGINRAAHEGIIVKGGAAIEQIGRAQAFVFDKTGTLTFGSPVVSDIVAFDGFTKDQVITAAGSVEQLSAHVLGKTLTAAAVAAGNTLSIPTNFREIPGKGVEGMVDGKHIRIGSPRFLLECTGHSIPPGDYSSGLATYVAIDDNPAGAILFNDKIRPGVPEMMARLKSMGVRKTVMLTGDKAEHANKVAKEAGIDTVAADLLPEDKVTNVVALKKRYSPLVMVGDGINDAPALAIASVGVAMGAHGSGISAEAADMVLLVDDVRKVGEAMWIGQRMLRIAKQSIYIGLGVSFALMVVAATGHISAPTGALLQEVLDAAVILNALRAR
ncbi:MAG TPA: heavy metal translocating P-type ATPase [Capsulimonadaceae bacterium]